MSILAVIPARGGSKGVKKKNIKDLGGKPLISYTLETALSTDIISDIVVSTDDHDIADYCKKYSEVYVPFLRPKELSTDKSLSAPVVIHALNFMEAFLEKKYDLVLMLQPTSPMRKPNHIKESFNILENGGFDSVVSVVDVDGYHPLRMKTISNGKLENFIDQGFEDMRPRQDLPKVYIRNGAIYLIKRESLLKNQSLVSSKCGGYIMDSCSSVNIDSKNDFLMAEILINQDII